jgi:hypothetical protein
MRHGGPASARRRHYNEVRPHMSLQYRTPPEFKASLVLPIEQPGRESREAAVSPVNTGPQKPGRSMAREPAAGVRAEIVKALALTNASAADVEAVFSRALNDESPAVVGFAAVGIRRTRPPDGAGLLAPLLASATPRVRLQAALGLQAYGEAARPYAPLLKAALVNERDPGVRNTRQAALGVIGGIQ